MVSLLQKQLGMMATFGATTIATAIAGAQQASPPNAQQSPTEAATQAQPAAEQANASGQAATTPQPSTVPAATAPAPSSNTASAPEATASSPTPLNAQAPATNAAPPKAAAETRPIFGPGGLVQVGAILQGWLDTTWNSDVAAGASRHTSLTFRIRRAEIKVYGDIVPNIASYVVSFDPASTYKFSTTNYTVASPAGATPATQTVTTSTPPGNTAALKLFWVSLQSPFVDAAIGQFKYPISYEGQSSSAELAFPERAFSTRYFGDTYDMGFRLEKKLEWFKYQAFLLNGSGQNQLDKNLQKDLAVRLEFTPVEGITFGPAGITSLGQRTTQTTTKDTVEFFGRLNKAGFLVQGELLWGKTGSTAPGNERTKAAGRYAVLGYTIANTIQPVIRYGYLNTDKTVTLGQSSSYALYAPFNLVTDEVRSYEIGLNYFVKGNNFKLQAAYGYYDFDKVPGGQLPLQEFTFVGQAAF